MWFYMLTKWAAIAYGILWILRYFLKRSWGRVDKKNEVNAKGKIVLITGASAGIGRAAALEFATRDANIVLACRSIDRAIQTINWIRSKTSRGQLICMKLDLESFQSVRKFANDFKTRYDRIDVLVLNAGVVYPLDANKKTLDGLEIHMAVNHLSHFLLTNLLLEQVKNASPSRIVTVGSTVHSWVPFNVNDMMSEKDTVKPKSDPMANYLYCRSKKANALFNVELSKRLRGTGVNTYALCPGMVVTNLGSNQQGTLKKLLSWLLPILPLFFKSPEDGAATIMHCALSKNLISDTGKMYRDCRIWEEKDRVVLKDEDAKKLWEESVKYVGL